MRIELIVNTSDDDELEALRAAVGRLREGGHAVRPHLTFERGDGARLAREAAGRDAGLVIVAGGDGTINEAANGLVAWMEDRRRAGLDCAGPRVGIVPLGTGNDLAGALEIPEQVEEAVAVALVGRERRVDVAVVNGRCFLNVSTGGFGAEATEETSDEAKRVLGPLAYVVTGVRKFALLDVSSARFVTGEGETIHDGPFLVFAVGNSRRTGGGNWLTPRAKLDDGLLDVCIVREMSRMDLVGLAPQLRAGRHLEHPAVVYRQVPSLVVEGEDELSVNADGEPMHGRRFDYGISPHRLALMAP